MMQAATAVDPAFNLLLSSTAIQRFKCMTCSAALSSQGKGASTSWEELLGESAEWCVITGAAGWEGEAAAPVRGLHGAPGASPSVPRHPHAPR